MKIKVINSTPSAMKTISKLEEGEVFHCGPGMDGEVDFYVKLGGKRRKGMIPCVLILAEAGITPFKVFYVEDQDCWSIESSLVIGE